ncbi:DUF5134 domain-containing protein [Streptomyces flavotricini]|uniref:DUF5134 domain-containing protein n=1 Tax=Streptomyces flavotricini TaxID=66888 RepID=A0ABS8EET9_9ACTN|nr:DUF5134 domain-containing protein [Streptomyces flavotricini]MCC0099586.1 DUF5134 domain-containing protein [Streptomyces flavotricini]
MSLPASLSAWLLVLLCAVSGAYCLSRARRSEREARGGAAGEALMGFGMAVMAVPAGIGPWGPRVLLAVFCGAVLHALWLLRGGVHHAHHLVGSLAMAYMALTMADGHGHGHDGGPPLVTGALLLYFAGYVLLGGARLVTAGGGAPPVAGGPSAKPAELTRACRLAMGIGMLAMLLSL